MNPDDARWAEQALAIWQFVQAEKFKIPAQPLTRLITFDDRCVYIADRPVPGRNLEWRTSPVSGGSITLPNGEVIPKGVTAAAGSTGNPADDYFVMSLPSVWRAAGVKTRFGVEGLVNGVFVHEVTHTRQIAVANAVNEELQRRYGISDEIGDDSLQETFQKNPEYVADYTAERDLLFRAAAAPTKMQTKQLAREALQKLRSRRAKWFTGTNEHWALVDDLYLMMEGVAQWGAYAWYIDPRGGGHEPSFALAEVRRGGRWWTQDEGLALLLTVDRLLPGWQQLVFANKPMLAEELLARATL